MANEKNRIRDELQNYKFEFGLLKKVPCTLQESKEYEKILKDGGVLPEGIHVDQNPYEGSFYTIHEADLTDAEISEYLTYKQLSLVRTIKSCAVFFTTLTIIGLLLYFIYFLMLLGVFS